MLGKKRERKITILLLVAIMLLQTFSPVVAIGLGGSDDFINVASVSKVDGNIEILGTVTQNTENTLVLQLENELEEVPIEENGSFIITKSVEELKSKSIILKFGEAVVDLSEKIMPLLDQSEDTNEEIVEEPTMEDPVVEEELEEETTHEEPVIDESEIDEISEEPKEDVLPIEEPVEEINHEEVEGLEYPEGEFIETNPDNLTGPEEADGYINYGIYPETSFGSQTLSRNFRTMLSQANNPPVIGVEHPTEPGEVMLFKQATPVDGLVNTWDITLRIEGKDSKTTSDIVLVIDRSGSMNNEGRMNAAKAAANRFVDTLLGDKSSSKENTRISVVSFANDIRVDQGLTNNTSNLHNAINDLRAIGGTFTQGAMRQASAILANSDANMKSIVLLSDGEPTYGYAINETYRNNTANLEKNYNSLGGAWQTKSDTPQNMFSYNLTAGIGSSMFSRYYPVAAGGGSSPEYRYYNFGNHAIAEAGFSKGADYNVYTVDLQAGDVGNSVLNRMASPGKSYTAKPEDLAAIFSDIAGEISSAVNSAVVSDPMGTGFTVFGPMTSISVSQGTYSYDETKKTIKWNIGNTLTNYVEGQDGVRYAEMHYRIEIDDDIIGAKANGNNYSTNGDATVSYKDSDGKPQTLGFPVPEVDPIIIAIEKKLINSLGFEVTDSDNRSFAIRVTSHKGYDKYYGVNAGGSKFMRNIRLEDTYTVSETSVQGSPTSQLSDYDTTYNIYGEDKNTFNIGQTNTDTSIIVTNREKPLGVLKVEKIFEPLNTQSGSRMAQMRAVPDFEFTVTGPTDANGNTYKSKFTLKPGETKTLENLPYGEYTVVETPNSSFEFKRYEDDYGEPSDGKVTLSIDGKERYVRVINGPKIGESNTTLIGHKIYVNGPSETHLPVEMNVYADGALMDPQPGTPKVTHAEGTSTKFTYEWTGLQKYNQDGKLIKYTIDEKEVPENYVRTLSDDGLTVTNTYQQGAGVTFIANKQWDNGDPNERPEVYFKLYRKTDDVDEEVPGAELKKITNSELTATWDDLTKNSPDGKEYIYYVKEVNSDGTPFESDEYTVTYPENNRVVNTYNPPTSTVKATKVWDNGSDSRPTVWFQLYRQVQGGIPEIASTEIKELPNGTTEVTWDKIPQKSLTGQEYTFFVRETDKDGNIEWSPENYSKVENGLTVTNTFTPPLTEITANKVWEGGPEPRPIVGLRLYRYLEGKVPNPEVDAVSGATPNPLLSGETEETWSVPKTDMNNVPYVYYVREVHQDGEYTPGTPIIKEGAPPNYIWTNSEEFGLTVNNKYKSPTIDVEAKKTWTGGPSEKPTVWFQLWRTTGEGMDEIVPNAEVEELSDGTTEVIWEGQDQTDKDGNIYTYYVKEGKLDGETFTEGPPENYYQALPHNTLVVSNVYRSPVIDTTTATKTWVDGPTDRPELWFKIWRQYEGGDLQDQFLDSSEWHKKVPGENEDGVASVTWENLPQFDFDTGKEYTYWVEEGIYDEFEGFTPGTPENYELSGEKTLGLINTYVAPKTEEDIVATKVWHENIPEGVTKPSIKFELWRKNGTAGEGELVVAATELTEDKVNFGKHDKTDINGVEYEYYVKEIYDNPDDLLNQNWSKVEKGLQVTNSVIDENDRIGKLTVKKVLVNEPTSERSMRLQGATNPLEFEFKVTGPYGYEETFTLKAGEEKELTGLYYGNYNVEETNSHGYSPNYAPGQDVSLSVGTSDVTVVVTNTNKGGTETDPTTVSKTITKVWENGPKTGATLELWRKGQEVDGTAIDEKVGESFNATATELTKTYPGLAKHDPSGREFEYYVKEDTVPENYTASINQETLTVTNTFKSPEDGEFETNKEWDISTLDEGLTVEYPTMIFTLYRSVDNENWEKVPGADPIEITEEQTYAKWENLVEYDDDGNKYQFKVEETFKEEDILNENWVKEESDGNISNRLIYNDEDPHNPDDPNHPDEKIASLTIKKIVIPESSGSNKKFKVKVTGPYGYEQVIEIAHNQTVKLEELYYGQYEVTEIDNDGYVVEYSDQLAILRKDNPDGEITITNKKLAPDTKVVTAKKEWLGDKDWDQKEYDKPDTWFKLQRRISGGEWEDVINSVKQVPKSNQVLWTVEIKNSDGKTYKYRVKEVDRLGKDYVPAGFTKKEDGLTVRNYKTTDLTPPPWILFPVPELNKNDHFGYVIGYPEGDFRPEGTITRAEMTAIFARLLEEKIFLAKDYPIPFNDVSRNAWYAEYIGMLTQIGIISGYPDGSFRPERELSRAETVTIVNRMLDRVADKAYVDRNARTVINYIDLTNAHWAYYDIMEASNSHDYERTTNRQERWIRHWRPY